MLFPNCLVSWWTTGLAVGGYGWAETGNVWQIDGFWSCRLVKYVRGDSLNVLKTCGLLPGELWASDLRMC